MTQEEIPLEAMETGLPYILEIMIMTDLETCTGKRGGSQEKSCCS